MRCPPTRSSGTSTMSLTTLCLMPIGMDVARSEGGRAAPRIPGRTRRDNLGIKCTGIHWFELASFGKRPAWGQLYTLVLSVFARESGTTNLEVAGSNPAGRTTENPVATDFAAGFVFAMRTIWGEFGENL